MFAKKCCVVVTENNDNNFAFYTEENENKLKNILFDLTLKGKIKHFIMHVDPNKIEDILVNNFDLSQYISDL